MIFLCSTNPRHQPPGHGADAGPGRVRVGQVGEELERGQPAQRQRGRRLGRGRPRRARADSPGPAPCGGGVRGHGARMAHARGLENPRPRRSPRPIVRWSNCPAVLSSSCPVVQTARKKQNKDLP